MSDDRLKEELYKKLAEAEEQLENGELLESQKVFKSLNKKYADDIEVERVANKILEKHKAVFEELAKGENKE